MGDLDMPVELRLGLAFGGVAGRGVQPGVQGAVGGGRGERLEGALESAATVAGSAPRKSGSWARGASQSS